MRQCHSLDLCDVNIHNPNPNPNPNPITWASAILTSAAAVSPANRCRRTCQAARPLHRITGRVMAGAMVMDGAMVMVGAMVMDGAMVVDGAMVMVRAMVMVG